MATRAKRLNNSATYVVIETVDGAPELAMSGTLLDCATAAGAMACHKRKVTVRRANAAELRIIATFSHGLYQTPTVQPVTDEIDAESDVVVKVTHLDREVEYKELPYPDALSYCSEMHGLCISCNIYK